jgi:hypothetical protein
VNRRLATIIAAGAAGAFAIALPLHALPKGVRDTYNKSGDTVVACGDNTLTFHAPADLWPPNHKYYDDITVTYTDGDGGDVNLTSDGTHDNYDADTGTEANGSGNTADDITSDDADATDGPNSSPTHPVATEDGSGSVTTDWDARAERAGTIKEGRTYTLHAIGTSKDDGSTCEGEVQMHVPHDMSPKNR